MAIVVLVLWLFTAGAGLYLLVTSSLGRARPAGSAAPHPQPASVTQPAPAPGARSAPVTQPPTATTSVATPASVVIPASATTPEHPATTPASTATSSRRAARRAARERWDPPSLVAARQAPILPSARSLAEFVHPAGGITGLGFWLGFTLVHNRALGWIAFGLVVATAGMGLGWFTANNRAARHADPSRPAPSFTGRLVALHGSAAALTVTLAALTALVLRG